MIDDYRKADPTPEAIDKMILETENLKDRAMLMIMRDIATRIATHEKTEFDLFVQAKRLMMVILAFTHIILAGLIWYGARVQAQFDDYVGKTDTLWTEVEKHKEHHRLEERFNGGPKVAP